MTTTVTLWLLLLLLFFFLAHGETQGTRPPDKTTASHEVETPANTYYTVTPQEHAS